MPGPLLGREGGFDTLSERQQREVLSELLDLLEEGQVLETACWAVDLHPEEMAEYVRSHPRTYRAIQRRMARAEVALYRKVQEGGLGLSKAKAALETLKLTRKAWTPKSQVDLGKRFEEALSAVRDRLQPEQNYTGDEAYEIVVAEFLKHES